MQRGSSASRTSCASPGRSRRSRRSSPSTYRPLRGPAGSSDSRALRSTWRRTPRSSRRSSDYAPARSWRRSPAHLEASGSASSAFTSDVGVPGYNPANLPAISGRVSAGPARIVPIATSLREARMAARLQLKLGLVAEHDRPPDSPDTLVVVEPSVGSVARSKGNLYLLVTARVSSRHALEATRLAAETIRNEYYYDESAGIRVCVQKAIATANKRLIHQADRLGLKSPDGNGPIGVGLAVVRGNEMYVATVGPAEAYLIRQARLSTLPDPHRERGLPSGALEPDVWRGEISVGDSLVLVSPNVVAKLGADELKDAMLTLHPQSAMEHLPHRFVAAEGSGSDGAIAFEATEVSATARGRSLVPVRPAEPLAGAPDRSPIPLADNVQAAGSAVSAAAGRAKVAAGGALGRVVQRVQDLMPRRKPADRRVTPLASRRETQRRAALALLALVVVVGGLGLGVYAFGGNSTQGAISSVNAGQKALDQARADL